MEQISFEVFKQSIVETDELLYKVKLKDQQIEKLKKDCDALSKSLKCSRYEVQKLKHNIGMLAGVETKYGKLEKENSELQKELAHLKDDTSKTINNLTIKYQMANVQSQECLQLSPKKKKDKKDPSEQLSKKVEALESEKMKLREEKNTLLSANKDFLKEVYELKKKLDSRSDNSNLKIELDSLKIMSRNKDEEIRKLTEEKNTKRCDCKRKEEIVSIELGRIMKEMKTIEGERDEMRLINEGLREQNSSLQVEISLLQEKENTDLPDLFPQINEETVTILNEDNSKSQESVENMLDIHKVTEKSMKIVEETRTVTPTDEEICEIMKEITIPDRLSPINNLTSVPGREPLLSLEAQNLPEPSINVEEVLNRRQKRQIARRKSRHVDLYGALVALKRANIGFIISSNSNMLNLPQPRYSKKKIFKNVESKQTYTTPLNCHLDCCNSAVMVLRDSKLKEKELLGFIEVKDEKDNKLCNKIVDVNIQLHDSCVSRLELSNVTEICDPVTTVENSTTKNKKSVQVTDISVSQVPKENNSRTSKRRQTDALLPNLSKKMIKHNSESVHSLRSAQSMKDTKIVDEKLKVINQTQRTSFKKPVCVTRRSSRLVTSPKQPALPTQPEQKIQDFESPRSPSPLREESGENPIIIPLEKIPRSTVKMPTTKIEMLFNKLILYSSEEEALNEVVGAFLGQEPEYVAEAVLERVSLDHHDSPDAGHRPAPPMTHVQRTLLGFMAKLEKSTCGVFDSFLTLAERRLLTLSVLEPFGPITRLYLAVCMQRRDVMRMRRLCCDVFYFCGDLAVPFLFTVLTSWTRVMPMAAEAQGYPVARIMVQLVLTKECNKPGYNFMPLRDLLIKYYGYPTERWDPNALFDELYHSYLKNPSKSTDLPLLLLCKYNPEKWVHEKVEEYLKPLVHKPIQDNFKATVIILIGNLYNRFSSKSEVNYLPKVREWLISLVTGETPDVVKRCIYVTLHRLKTK